MSPNEHEILQELFHDSLKIQYLVYLQLTTCCSSVYYKYMCYSICKIFVMQQGNALKI